MVGPAPARCKPTLVDSHLQLDRRGLAPTTPGDAFDARFDDEEDAIVFRRIKRGGKSWLDILKACPVPLEDLPPRSREYPRKPRL